MEKQSCCTKGKLVGSYPGKPGNEAIRSCHEKWVSGLMPVENGQVPIAKTRLTFQDTWGSWKARWTMGRMAYRIHPGLYGVGKPGRLSPVLVTANYKMTFDRLRQELAGFNAWILVLDTKGINVWCAAGKGTFSDQEVIRKIRAVGLDKILDHRTIILPQLGATGVKAYEITKETGFQVVYGPVRAADLPGFLNAGNTATAKMRQVRFDFRDRIVLTPAELVFTIKPAAIAFGVLFILNSIGFGHYGLIELYALSGALLTGCVLTPALLPLIPGRAFAFKGALTGLVFAIGVALLNGWFASFAENWAKMISFLMLLPAISSFYAMNFTGSTTYTSPSGVNKEMRLALPVMLTAAACGILLFLTDGIIRHIR